MKTRTRWLAALVCLVCLGISGHAYAGDDGADDLPTPTPTLDLLSLLSQTTPAPVSPISTFTPDGNGTVLDNVTDADGKEFFTIMTPNENVFFLVIDRQRDEENVYFLNAVTEADLLALTAEAGIKPTPTPDVMPTPQPTISVITEPEKKAPSGGLIMGVLLMLAGGAGFYYVKFVKPGKGTAAPEDEEYDYEDEEEEEAELGQDADYPDEYDHADE